MCNMHRWPLTQLNHLSADYGKLHHAGSHRDSAEGVRQQDSITRNLLQEATAAQEHDLAAIQQQTRALQSLRGPLRRLSATTCHSSMLAGSSQRPVLHRGRLPFMHSWSSRVQSCRQRQQHWLELQGNWRCW